MTDDALDALLAENEAAAEAVANRIREGQQEAVRHMLLLTDAPHDGLPAEYCRQVAINRSAVALAFGLTEVSAREYARRTGADASTVCRRKQGVAAWLCNTQQAANPHG